MTRLSLRLPFHSDETLISYCSRTAVALGHTNSRTFACHMGFTLEGLAHGNPADVETFGYIANLDSRALKAAVVKREGDFTFIGGERLTRLYVRRSPLRFCPHCLDHDEINGPGRSGVRAYGRRNWLVALIRCCPIHGTKIVTSDIAGTTHVNDFMVRLAWERPNMRSHRMHSTPAKPTKLEQYVARRLQGVPSGYAFLDAMPLHVVAHMTELVGTVHIKGILEPVRREHYFDYEDAGFEIMSAGEESFRKFLRSLHANFRRSSMHSLAGVYGRLYTGVRLKDRSYDRVRAVMRDVALAELPFAPGDDVFGPVETTRWHSIPSLSSRFGMGTKRMESLLRANGLLPAKPEPGRANAFVHVEAAADFLKDLETAVSSPAAAAYLRMPQPALHQLLAAGQIKSHHVRKGPRALEPYFSILELDRFVDRLRQSVTTDGYPQGAVDLRTAPRRGRTNASRVISLIFNGDLKTVAWDSSKTGYGAVLVVPREVREALRRPVIFEGFTVPQARKQLRAAGETILDLIRHGYLEASIAHPRPTKRTPPLIPAAKLQQFKAEYEAVSFIAQKFRTTPRRLGMILRSLGVLPAFDPALVRTTYYRRKEIEVHAEQIAKLTPLPPRVRPSRRRPSHS
ncbi:TniQ family protein (plasmid) [Ensifer adhaerens]|uniref:TniQ family protein n=1 Tax=Ensifer adhaerens TaxID=106592 RepID=UPI0023A963BE|nr:TniQ family protein [Ensifer adhaerens]WDZ79138.1 TniQ family protein [Ensifer adhaerens]